MIATLLQAVGFLVLIPVGVLVLFGLGWCLLAAGVVATVAGVALELERRAT